jgi:hypothetical protein
MAKLLSGPRYRHMLDALDVIEPTKAERKAARNMAFAREMALKYCDLPCHGIGCIGCTQWETKRYESLSNLAYADHVDDLQD